VDSSMNTRMACCLALAVVVATAVVVTPPAAGELGPRRALILVTLDGARVEEVFAGLDEAVARDFAKQRGTHLGDWEAFRALGAPTARERRERLMPFVWGTLLRRYGSIAGNPARGSLVRITNHYGYSWPGYAEMLTGSAHDDCIQSNDDRHSPATTFLEHAQSVLATGRDKVAVFASWSRFRGIAEQRVGSVLVDVGPGAVPTPWPDMRQDDETFERAFAHLRTHRPELMHIALGETDEWAHDGDYARVLAAYQRSDGYLRRLWNWIEADPHYQGRTCLVIATDHGRGSTKATWRHHGPTIPGTQLSWLVVVSPDLARRGEWMDAPTLQLREVPAILSDLMGLPRDRFGPSRIAQLTAVEARPVAQACCGPVANSALLSSFGRPLDQLMNGSAP
jgi:hypothetical protein